MILKLISSKESCQSMIRFLNFIMLIYIINLTDLCKAIITTTTATTVNSFILRDQLVAGDNKIPNDLPFSSDDHPIRPKRNIHTTVQSSRSNSVKNKSRLSQGGKSNAVHHSTIDTAENIHSTEKIKLLNSHDENHFSMRATRSYTTLVSYTLRDKFLLDDDELPDDLPFIDDVHDTTLTPDLHTTGFYDYLSSLSSMLEEEEKSKTADHSFKGDPSTHILEFDKFQEPTARGTRSYTTLASYTLRDKFLLDSDELPDDLPFIDDVHDTTLTPDLHSTGFYDYLSSLSSMLEEEEKSNTIHHSSTTESHPNTKVEDFFTSHNDVHRITQKHHTKQTHPPDPPISTKKNVLQSENSNPGDISLKIRPSTKTLNLHNSNDVEESTSTSSSKSKLSESGHSNIVGNDFSTTVEHSQSVLPDDASETTTQHWRDLLKYLNTDEHTPTVQKESKVTTDDVHHSSQHWRDVSKDTTAFMTTIQKVNTVKLEDTHRSSKHWSEIFKDVDPKDTDKVHDQPSRESKMHETPADISETPKHNRDAEEPVCALTEATSPPPQVVSTMSAEGIVDYWKRDLISFQVITKALIRHAATIIFLHGYGDNGYRWSMLFDKFKRPYMKVLCPQTDRFPISFEFGHAKAAWFDKYFDGREDEKGIIRATKEVQQLLDEEVKNGLPANRIILCGSCQGAALALRAALSYPHKLAGVVALSAWMPMMNTFDKYYNPVNKDIPILQMQGLNDTAVNYRNAQSATSFLKKYTKNTEYRSVNGAEHDLYYSCEKELEQFLAKHVAPD